MKRLSILPVYQKHQLWKQLYKIADYNKKLFFSGAWQQSIFDEFVTNLTRQLTELEQFKTGQHWRTLRDAWVADSQKLKLTNSWLIKSMHHQADVEKLFNQYP